MAPFGPSACSCFPLAPLPHTHEHLSRLPRPPPQTSKTNQQTKQTTKLGTVEWDVLRLISPLEWAGLLLRRLIGLPYRRLQWPAHGIVPADVRYEPEAVDLPLNGLYRVVLLLFLIGIQLCGSATWYHVFLLSIGCLPGATLDSLQARMYLGQSWMKVFFVESDVASLNAAAFYLLLVLQVYTLTAMLTYGSLLVSVGPFSARRSIAAPAGGKVSWRPLHVVISSPAVRAEMEMVVTGCISHTSKTRISLLGDTTCSVCQCHRKGPQRWATDRSMGGAARIGLLLFRLDVWAPPLHAAGGGRITVQVPFIRGVRSPGNGGRAIAGHAGCEAQRKSGRAVQCAIAQMRLHGRNCPV